MTDRKQLTINFLFFLHVLEEVTGLVLSGSDKVSFVRNVQLIEKLRV